MGRWTLAIALACGLAGAPALAQPAAPAVPPAPAAAEPSARALELSRRLIVAMHLTDQMSVMMRTLAPQMVELQTRQIPEFRPEWRQPLSDAVTEATTEDLMPGLLKRAESIYARVFTEDELAQAAAFYESPAGQSMVRKAPSIGPLLMQDFQALTQSLGADVHGRFCKKIGGCEKAAAPPAKS